MPLSRGLALAIVDVIAADPECKRRIDSGLSAIMPSSLGWTGSVRNYGFAFKETYKAIFSGGYSAQPTTEQDDLVCYGIRDATIEALEKALKKVKGDSTLSAISEVSYVIRDDPIVHTATLITVTKRWKYVFDWHATLETRNPLIYPSEKAFMENRDSVVFSSFTGFD